MWRLNWFRLRKEAVEFAGFEPARRSSGRIHRESFRVERRAGRRRFIPANNVRGQAVGSHSGSEHGTVAYPARIRRKHRRRRCGSGQERHRILRTTTMLHLSSSNWPSSLRKVFRWYFPFRFPSLCLYSM